MFSVFSVCCSFSLFVLVSVCLLFSGCKSKCETFCKQKNLTNQKIILFVGGFGVFCRIIFYENKRGHYFLIVEYVIAFRYIFADSYE